MRISPDFSALGLALAVALAAYLAVGESIHGKRSYERLRRTRGTDPKALTRLYARWISGSWAWVAVVGAVLLASPGVAPSDLGLTAPDDLGGALGTVTGIGVAILVSTLALRRWARSGRKVPGQDAFAELLPRTRAERGYALAMAVTAGVCEEIVFRGLLIALGVGALGLDPRPAAVLALAVFTLGHLYQGWKGMAAVAAVGWLLSSLYLATGSLLAPIVAHILIDVRGLVLTPAPARRPAEPFAPARIAG